MDGLVAAPQHLHASVGCSDIGWVQQQQLGAAPAVGCSDIGWCQHALLALGLGPWLLAARIAAQHCLGAVPSPKSGHNKEPTTRCLKFPAPCATNSRGKHEMAREKLTAIRTLTLCLMSSSVRSRLLRNVGRSVHSSCRMQPSAHTSAVKGQETVSKC